MMMMAVCTLNTHTHTHTYTHTNTHTHKHTHTHTHTHTRSVDKELLFSIAKRIIDGRKNSTDTSKDLPFIDALLSAHLPEETTHADVVSYLIGEFHTSGYCEYTAFSLVYYVHPV